MATEYKLQYTASEINRKLGQVDELSEAVENNAAEIDTKQDALVSGTNIKTINGESILGEGNITIVGGGGSGVVDEELDETSENPVQNKVIAIEVEAIKNTLDGIMYDEKHINSFSNNIGIAEFGSTVTNVTLNWTINKQLSSLTLDGSAIDVNSTGETLSGLNIKSDKTWTLVATDENGYVDIKTTTISFLKGVYYGTISDYNTINNAVIRGLNKSLQDSKEMTFEADAGEGQYIAFAMPVNYDEPTFSVSGIEGGFRHLTTFGFTNSSSHTEQYNVWISDNAGLGVTTVKVS